MPSYDIGNIIKERREALNIFQKDLCLGLCSVATLSKIEDNSQFSSMALINAILDRLGLPVDLCSFVVSETEFARHKLEVEICSKPAQSISALLLEYKNVSPVMTSLEEQFYLYALSLNNYSYVPKSTTWENLLLSLRKTVPDFNADVKHSSFFFTTRELVIMYHLANLEYYNMHLKSRARKRMYFILKCFKKKSPSPLRIKYYIEVLNRLGGMEEASYNYKKEYEIADEGIDFCLKHNSLGDFAYMLYTKAFVLCKMGRSDSAKDIFKQAFSLMSIQNKPKDAILRGIKEAQSLVGESFLNEDDFI